MAKNDSSAKSAEAYREERKARLAKAAKQNSKKSRKIDAPKMSKKAKAIISIVVILAVAAGISYGCLYYFGAFERMKTVVEINGTEYSAAEYEYHYRSAHYRYYQMSYEYDNYYGSGYGKAYTGYDYTLAPAEQEYTGTDFTLESGETPTWQDYFEYATMQSLKQYTQLLDDAEKDGFKLDSAKLKEVDNTIEELRQTIYDNATNTENAEASGVVVSLGTYLRGNYGRGMSESLFRKLVEEETLVQAYYEKINDDKMSSYTEDKILETYTADPSAYDLVDFRGFYISPETPETAEGATEAETTAATEKAKTEAKAKADKMFAAITDSASFKKLAEENATAEQKESYDYTEDSATLSRYYDKQTVTENISKDIADWLFDAERKVGDKTVIDTNGTYAILLMVKTAYRDDETLPIDVRHILFQFNSELTDEAEIAADKEDCLSKAQEALDEWKTGDATEESFGELASEKSADTGSASNGGLIESVTKGQMVAPFETWCFDEARKTGDTDIVETTYGYHVMYFVKQHAEPYWKENIRTTLATEEVDKYTEEKLESETYAPNELPALAELKKSLYSTIVSTFYTEQAAPQAA